MTDHRDAKGVSRGQGRLLFLSLLVASSDAFLKPKQQQEREKRWDHACIERHVVNASDNTRLTTIVVIPYPCDGKYPAVIDRSPYGPALDLLDLVYVPEGFTAIIQNQRGCFTSGGDYNFWKQDGSDALDTMRWFVDTQPTSNGDVFISGASADGISAFSDYTINNTLIKGYSAIWATAFAHETCYWGGAYREDLISHWLLTLDTCPNSANIEVQVRENEAYNDWWAPIEATPETLANVNAPGVSQAGWWDIFLQGQIDTFEATRQYAQESVRDQQWLWIIPGGHCTGDEADFGFPKFESLESWPAMAAQVFAQEWDHRIFEAAGRYNVYVMGPVPLYSTTEQRQTHVGNYWTSFDEWPETTPTKWYLGPEGLTTDDAGVAATWKEGDDDGGGGDGTRHMLTHDPSAEPVPAIGANTLFSSSPCGPRNLGPATTSPLPVLDGPDLPARADVLSWTAAAPFTEPAAMVGRLEATLVVSSTAVDTDFYVTVTDQYPPNPEDGSPGPLVNVRYGAAKMRWNTPAATDAAPANMVPGEAYTVTLDLWSTAYVWNAGHTLGVLISSSRYPEFPVNPNNGYPLSQQDDGPKIVANNTVISSSDRLSYVTLPMVSLDDIKLNPEIR